MLDDDDDAFMKIEGPVLDGRYKNSCVSYYGRKNHEYEKARPTVSLCITFYAVKGLVRKVAGCLHDNIYNI